MTFPEKLIALRTKACLKQAEVAEGAQMSVRSYQNYEWNLREPKMTALIALADFYNISLDELVCREWPGEEPGKRQGSKYEELPELQRKMLIQLETMNDGQRKAVLAFMNWLNEVEQSLSDSSK